MPWHWLWKSTSHITSSFWPSFAQHLLPIPADKNVGLPPLLCHDIMLITPHFTIQPRPLTFDIRCDDLLRRWNFDDCRDASLEDALSQMISRRWWRILSAIFLWSWYWPHDDAFDIALVPGMSVIKWHDAFVCIACGACRSLHVLTVMGFEMLRRYHSLNASVIYSSRHTPFRRPPAIYQWRISRAWYDFYYEMLKRHYKSISYRHMLISAFHLMIFRIGEAEMHTVMLSNAFIRQ